MFKYMPRKQFRVKNRHQVRHNLIGPVQDLPPPGLKTPESSGPDGLELGQGVVLGGNRYG